MTARRKGTAKGERQRLPLRTMRRGGCGVKQREIYRLRFAPFEMTTKGKEQPAAFGARESTEAFLRNFVQYLRLR
jgi:hypothetical protein